MRQTEHRATAAAEEGSHSGSVPDDVTRTWTLLHSLPPAATCRIWQVGRLPDLTRICLTWADCSEASLTLRRVLPGLGAQRDRAPSHCPQGRGQSSAPQDEKCTGARDPVWPPV